MRRVSSPEGIGFTVKVQVRAVEVKPDIGEQTFGPGSSIDCAPIE